MWRTSPSRTAPRAPPSGSLAPSRARWRRSNAIGPAGNRRSRSSTSPSMRAGKPWSATFHTPPEGGGQTETRRRPHERYAPDAQESALLSALEAHGRAVPRSGRDRLERVPVSWSGRGWAEGQAQRQLQTRTVHGRKRADAPYDLSLAAS